MAVIRMGVFDVFEEQKMTASEIAKKTGADPSLVGKAFINRLHVLTKLNFGNQSGL